MANNPTQGGNGHNDKTLGQTAAQTTGDPALLGRDPASVAKEKAALARDQLTVGVADAMDSGMEAARSAKLVLDEKLEGLMDSGKDVIDQAEELIRTRPWVSFGAAFAAGYLIAKLTRKD